MPAGKVASTVAPTQALPLSTMVQLLRSRQVPHGL
jgi:hypothetical protein